MAPLPPLATPLVARCALFIIILFVLSLYDTVTEETSKSPSGRHGNILEILDVSYDSGQLLALMCSIQTMKAFIGKHVYINRWQCQSKAVRTF